MADDWIKMRSNLWDHPKVVRLVSGICPEGVLDLSLRCRVIGALHRTWALFDTYTQDGILVGYTPDALDLAVGINGWSANLQHIGWLVIESQSLSLPEFATHNGESAKRRAEDAKRKREQRNARPDSVREMSGKNRTREEKRREEKSINKPASAHSAFEGITKDDLSDPDFPERFVESQQAKASPVVDASEATRHNVRAAAAKAVSDPSVQNPPAIFAWIVSGKRWDYLRSSHDDIAKAMKRKAQPRGEPAIQVPIKSLPDDHGPNNLQAIRNLARCIA